MFTIHDGSSISTLRELADLLGQVKPPTATKEDIDKSGLAIIKASELLQHEKDGKVSSNCLDRVRSAFNSGFCSKAMIILFSA
jgi:hypothetical protein